MALNDSSFEFDSSNINDDLSKDRYRNKESVEAIASKIKEIEFKRLCNIKIVRRLEAEFKQKYKSESMPASKAIPYSAFISNQEKQKLIYYSSLSFGITSVVIISRIPRINRFIRLGIYGTLGYSLYKLKQ